MSFTSMPASTDAGGARPEDQDWETELRRMLPEGYFPARQDDLLAVLLRQRAPSHLLWVLSRLPREVRFESLEDVCLCLARYAHQPRLVPPQPDEPM